MPSYDFEFEKYLTFRHPIYLPESARCIARVGAIADYQQFFDTLSTAGLSLINEPDQSRRANNLQIWAPLLADLTPATLVFDGAVDVARVEDELGYPLFVKTVQQTLGHRRDLAFVDDREGLLRSITAYRSAPTLAGQALAIRKRVPLRKLKQQGPAERVPACVEYRVFLLYGSIVGLGAYWTEGRSKNLDAHEEEVRTLALQVHARLQVPFLTVDIGQLEDGSFSVIETNDAQECGYAGIEPHSLWENVIAHYSGVEGKL